MAESNIERIISLILESESNTYNNNGNWIRTKTYWNEPIKPCNVSKLANTITNKIKENFAIGKNSIRTATNVSVVKKGNDIWFYRQEEALERLICLFNKSKSNNKWGNQADIQEDNSGKELVDLEECDSNNNYKSFIELKAWNNKKDTPLYAVIELLKNYYLCDKGKEFIEELILLAPAEYYDYYDIYNTNFKDLITELNKLLPQNCNISVKVIDLTLEKWNKFVKDKIPQNLQFQPANIKSDKYDYVASIDLEKCVKQNLFNEISEKLLKKSWLSIYDTSSSDA